MTRRAAFTIVELLLALMLSSLVLASMVGVVRVLLMADSVSAHRVDQQTDLAVAQNLIRRVMVSLAAAEPLDPATGAKLLREQFQPATESHAVAIGLSPMAPPDIAPMFDLYFEELEDGTAAPALECVIIDPPGALDPNASRFTLADFRTVAKGSTREGALLSRRIVQSVRGRFGIVPIADTETGEARLALAWTGIEPPSAPYVLLRGVVGLEWRILPLAEDQRDWRTTHSAKLAQDFPLSVRLIVWLDDGRQLDWMFETEMQALRPESDANEEMPELMHPLSPPGEEPEGDES